MSAEPIDLRFEEFHAENPAVYEMLVRFARERQGDFQIIHQERCDPGSEHYQLSMPLETFVGDDGLAVLLSWLSHGPVHDRATTPDVADWDEYVEARDLSCAARTHTPTAFTVVYAAARSDRLYRSWSPGVVP